MKHIPADPKPTGAGNLSICEDTHLECGRLELEGDVFGLQPLIGHVTCQHLRKLSTLSKKQAHQHCSFQSQACPGVACRLTSDITAAAPTQHKAFTAMSLTFASSSDCALMALNVRSTEMPFTSHDLRDSAHGVVGGRAYADVEL